MVSVLALHNVAILQTLTKHQDWAVGCITC
uniref:Uncharacterized protein n=1 Tax=Anguilla anguilla TaxID=7936 RepID=A0A0E9V6W7_ANGAN